MIHASGAVEPACQKSRGSSIFRAVLLIPLGWILGLFLIWLVYLMPSDAIFENAANSITAFEREGNYPMLVEYDQTTKLDNFTDAWMLNIAANREAAIRATPLERAIQQYWTRPQGSGELNQTAIFQTYFSGKSQNNELIKYGRYWGGFVIPLRIAMLMLNYEEIRIYNGIFQALLMNALLFMVWRRLGWRHCAAVIVAWLALEPVVLIFSLQYSACYYLGFGGALYLVAAYGGKTKATPDPVFAFTLLGMLTSYLDFLTYPIFTLGFPLLMYITGKEQDWKGKLRSLFLLSALWSLGYVGMWAGKLLIAGIFGYPAIVRNAISAFLVRVSLDGTEPINRLSVIQMNFHMYTRKMLLMMLFPALVVFLYGAAKALRHCQGRFTPLVAVPSLLTALLPLGWYLIASEHSFIHSWYSHRSLAITFAGICLMAGDVWQTQAFNKASKHMDRVN